MAIQRRTKALIISYAKDWILVIIFVVAFWLIDNVEPYHRVFSLTDTSLLHPYAVHERVPTWLLIVISLIAPLIFISLVSGINRNIYDFHNGFLGLALALALTITVTDVVKNTVGRPRPDFVDRCQPIPGSTDPLWGLSNSTICTQTNAYLIKDGFKSFPSGHASFSFAGMTYLSLYFAGKFRLFDRQGHTWKSFLFAIPLLVAALVAISRTMDYRHHWGDVFVGGILGAVIAVFSYHQYYPPLDSPQCAEPYSPRIPRDTSGGTLPLHQGDVHLNDAQYARPSTSGEYRASDALNADWGLASPNDGSKALLREHADNAGSSSGSTRY